MVVSIKITSGTKEWADTNINIYFGCSNDCVYCYAKRMAIRFKRKTKETWKIMELNEKALNRNYGKRKGRIMFPSSHDITPETLVNCVSVLRKILKAGNDVLITTKPRPVCIGYICSTLIPFKSQIQFRFTITSLDDNILEYWEKDAPNFEERFASLIYSYDMDFKTSVSIEPFLDKDPIPLIKKLYPYTTESIWIGKLNYTKTKFNNLENIMRIISRLENLPYEIKSKIRLKDSIKKMLERKCENSGR